MNWFVKHNANFEKKIEYLILVDYSRRLILIQKAQKLKIIYLALLF